jgi:hypothetical protein
VTTAPPIATATIALLVLGSACCQPRPLSPVQESPVQPAAAPAVAYRVLADGRLVHGAPPPDLHVEGTLDRGRFVPRGPVIGDGVIGASGHPGWVQLSTGAFVPAESAVAPVPPFVEGVMTDAGFVPASRDVVYGP